MKVLKLKNYHFVGNPELRTISFHEWLANRPLHGSQSRSRTRFLRELIPIIEEVEKVYTEIAEKYSFKKHGKTVRTIRNVSPEGKVEVTENTEGKGNIKIEKLDEFSKEFMDYLNEGYIIDVTPANQEMINGIKDILLKCNDEFSGRMALLYDEWCEAFENIKEEDDKAEKDVKLFDKVKTKK